MIQSKIQPISHSIDQDKEEQAVLIANQFIESDNPQILDSIKTKQDLELYKICIENCTTEDQLRFFYGLMRKREKVNDKYPFYVKACDWARQQFIVSTKTCTFLVDFIFDLKLYCVYFSNLNL